MPYDGESLKASFSNLITLGIDGKTNPMNRNIVFLLTVLATLTASSAILPADTDFDGHFWETCPPQVKQFYVQGVLSGILLGQDRVVRYGLPDNGTSKLSPACHRAIVGVVNALERQIGRWDHNRLVGALDAFYRKPENRSLGLQWAVMVVMLEMHGAPPEDIQE